MKIRRLLCLPLLLLCLALCACAKKPPESRDSISLWYPEDDPAAAALTALVEQYNESRDPARSPVSLRALSGADSLPSLQAGALPDLLLCSHGEALVLGEKGLLRDVSGPLGAAAPVYRIGLLPGDETLGRSVFPLGGAVPLLCLSADVPAPKDLEGLFALAAACGRDTGLPCLAVDSYAPLYVQLLLRRGVGFQMLDTARRPDEPTRDAYNLIAGAAYDHGLALTGQPAAPLVQAGLLSCAVVDSTALPGLTPDGCSLSPLPGLGEGDAYVTDLRCLAVTAREGRAGASLTAFLGWLYAPEQLDVLTRSAGLVPVHANAAPAGDALSGVLAEIGDRYSLRPADEDRDYLENHAAFEAWIRAALAGLT